VIKRIIFLKETIFTQRDYLRLGVDIIQKRGYMVEVWDFTPCLRPDYLKNYVCPDPFNFSGLQSYATFDDINAAVNDLSDKDILIDLSNLHRLISLSRYNRPIIGSLMLGLLPVSRNNKIIKYIKKIILDPRAFFLYVLHTIQQKIKPLKSLDFIITGGSGGKVSRKTTIIEAHSFDYDRYMEEGKRTIEVSSKHKASYAVFLDEDFSDSHDRYFMGIKPYPNSHTYHQEVNKFFDELESQTGFNVIISGHPKTDYIKKRNPFNRRKIISGKTAELIKNSSIVLAHGSTSLSFAVLYNKPALLLDSKSYPEYKREHIQNMSNALGLKKINIEKLNDFKIDEISINKTKYKSYKEQFIKKAGTPEKFVWDIFCDYVDNLH